MRRGTRIAAAMSWAVWMALAGGNIFESARVSHLGVVTAASWYCAAGVLCLLVAASWHIIWWPASWPVPLLRAPFSRETRVWSWRVATSASALGFVAVECTNLLVLGGVISPGSLWWRLSLFHILPLAVAALIYHRYLAGRGFDLRCGVVLLPALYFLIRPFASSIVFDLHNSSTVTVSTLITEGGPLYFALCLCHLMADRPAAWPRGAWA